MSIAAKLNMLMILRGVIDNIDGSPTCRTKGPPLEENIAKSTTDPRVEFISQDHSSQFTNLEHLQNFRTISEF